MPPGAATGVAIDAAGAAYVTGDADSTGNFQPSANAFQRSTSGSAALIVKFFPAPAMTFTTSGPGADTRTPVTLTAVLSGVRLDAAVMFTDGGAWIGTVILAGNTASMTLLLSAGIHSLGATLLLPGNASDTPVVSQVVDVALDCN